jgi:hypothetical protein
MIGTDPPASWDDDRDAYVADFDAESLPPSIAVAEALDVAREGSDRPLFDYVDPDALDALVTDSGPSMSVTFAVEEMRVTVHADGRVFVRPS